MEERPQEPCQPAPPFPGGHDDLREGFHLFSDVFYPAEHVLSSSQVSQMDGSAISKFCPFASASRRLTSSP